MTSTAPTVADEIERYLRTGQSDPYCRAWPGQSFLENAQLAKQGLLDALVAEVQRRAVGCNPYGKMGDADASGVFRAKIEQMVRGLFPRAEQDAVLSLVDRSVVFLGPDNIEEVLRVDATWLSTAWDLANLYLCAIGAEMLAPDAPRLVGLNQETTCFVSPQYFHEEDPFADFVVHEVAHVFHNCKRGRAGLPETRRREWLLDIAYGKRETFAYACEAYSCLLSRANGPEARIALAGELGDDFGTEDDCVEPGEVAALVCRAAERRNGWKVILAHCAPSRR